MESPQTPMRAPFWRAVAPSMDEDAPVDAFMGVGAISVAPLW